VVLDDSYDDVTIQLVELEEAMRERRINHARSKAFPLPVSLFCVTARLKQRNPEPLSERSEDFANAQEILASCYTETTFRSVFKAAFFDPSHPDVPLPGLPYDELIHYELDPVLKNELIPNSENSMTAARSMPDICYGFSRAAFRSRHLRMLAALPSDDFIVSEDQPCYWFPFLLCHVTLDPGIHGEMLQLANDGATLVNSLHLFHQRCGNPRPSVEDTIVFSIAGTAKMVETFMHWRHEWKQTVSFHMYRLNKAAMWLPGQVQTVRTMSSDIIEYSKTTRLSSIRRALERYSDQ
jgi:hypothetical protein